MQTEDLAREHREANHPDMPTADAPDVAVEAQPQAPNDGERKATLGPLGAFFKRRAEYFEQEATMLAVTLEQLARRGE